MGRAGIEPATLGLKTPRPSNPVFGLNTGLGQQVRLFPEDKEHSSRDISAGAGAFRVYRDTKELHASLDDLGVLPSVVPANWASGSAHPSGGSTEEH